MQIFVPMAIDRLAVHLAEGTDQDRRWLLLLEFLEEYEHEPAEARAALLQPEPPGTGDDQSDGLIPVSSLAVRGPVAVCRPVAVRGRAGA
ncbi:hypothetical protein BH24ACT1_BH24ACT1_08690 [soil metagenome]